MEVKDLPAVSLRLTLPAEVYQTFELRANQQGIEIEELLTRHLTTTQSQDNEKGRTIKLSPEDRQLVEKAFGRNFQTGRELTHYLEQMYTVRLGQTEIQLSPELLKRLDGRRGRMEFKAFLIETVVRQLEHFVGLR